MNNSFRLIHIGGPYGDCTSDYESAFDQPFKVKDLLAFIEKQTDEWGTIKFYLTSPYPYDCLSVSYKHGIINYEDFNKFSGKKNQNIFNTVIKKITANGGWSLMDYQVTLEK